MSKSSNTTKNIFWLTDPTILYSDGEYTNFIPTANMTRVQQLNSLTRFFLYSLILLSICGNLTKNWLQGIIIIIVFICFIYYVFESDKTEKEKDREPFKDDTNDVELETGYYDSAGDLQFGSFYSIENNKNSELDRSLDEYKLFQKNRCRKPTSDNPFMNPTLNDFNTENDPVPCNSNDEDIKNDVQDMFNKDLFKDLNDLFDIKNAQRQFYTVQCSTPQDTITFANWLYKSPPTCKEDNYACFPRDDYRLKTRMT